MKVLAIYGSPNKKGNSASISDAIIKGVESAGHFAEKFYLYDLKFSGCTDCVNADKIHKENVCIHEDDMRDMLIPKLIQADAILLSSPIYMGHITGPLKTFIDRWCTFINSDFTIRHLVNKKFVTVVTSGAPSEQFKNVTEFLDYWLTKFFKMKNAGQFHEGDLMGKGAISKQENLLKRAEEFGKNLFE
jgi:multimeric flavodoxin WrbA